MLGPAPILGLATELMVVEVRIQNRDSEGFSVFAGPKHPTRRGRGLYYVESGLLLCSMLDSINNEK